MIKAKFIGDFDKDYAELVAEDPTLQKVVFERIEFFKKNPDDTRLDNHVLTKKMKDRWAFSITDDIRIVYKWTGKKTVRFLAIGPHTKVYNQ